MSNDQWAKAHYEHDLKAGKQQVDEDALLALADKWDRAKQVPRYVDQDGVHSCAEQLRAALTSRQPGAQVPVVVEAVATIKRDGDGELYVDWLTEGGIHDLPVGDVLLAANSAITNDEGYGEVYATPPAQGTDLGQFRDLIGFAVLQAINLPETDPRRDFIRQANELLALIDQRDAAS